MFIWHRSAGETNTECEREESQEGRVQRREGMNFVLQETIGQM